MILLGVNLHGWALSLWEMMDGSTIFHWDGSMANLIILVDIGCGMAIGIVGGGARQMLFLGFIVTILKDGSTLIWVAMM